MPAQAKKLEIPGDELQCCQSLLGLAHAPAARDDARGSFHTSFIAKNRHEAILGISPIGAANFDCAVFPLLSARLNDVLKCPKRCPAGLRVGVIGANVLDRT